MASCEVILFIAPESVDKPAEDDDRLQRKGRGEDLKRNGNCIFCLRADKVLSAFTTCAVRLLGQICPHGYTLTMPQVGCDILE